MSKDANRFFPIVSIVTLIVLFWYGFSVVLNAPWAYDQAKRQSITLTLPELVNKTWSQKRPKLPTPHQVASEMWDTTVNQKISSKRSLVFHAWITFSETMLGFIMGMGYCIGDSYCSQQSYCVECDAVDNYESNHSNPSSCPNDNCGAWISWL